MSTSAEVRIRELDRRSSDSIDDVALFWNPSRNGVFVAVDDERRGESFALEVEAADALYAFRHPYAYAYRRATVLAAA